MFPAHRSIWSSRARGWGRFLVMLSVVAAISRAGGASANPTPGFVDHISSGVGAWGGGAFYANPGTGGVLGSGDGYLVVTTPGPDPFFTESLGARNLDPAYQGNWVAAGIAKVKLYLNDVGSVDPLEIHFCVGNGSNFWQFDTGFIPPAGSWSQFTVDLGAANWTRIVGTGTFAGALSTADRILIRHDRSPYVQNPDPISADVGIDEISLEAASNTGVPLPERSGRLALTLAAPYPNPSRDVVALAMESSDRSAISVEILDAAGRRVRTATLDGTSGGPHLWTWDGRTDAGTTAPPGVYRVRAWNAAGGMSRPLVRIAGGR